MCRASTGAVRSAASLNAKAQFQEVTPNRRLSWHGNVGADWLVAGDREFDIQPLAESSLVVEKEGPWRPLNTADCVA
jgi:hypothetical protein